MAYFKDMEPYGTIGDEWDGPIPAVYSLPAVPVRYAKDYCPGCSEIVAAGEPCECVFVAHGWVDARNVLHTVKRVPIYVHRTDSVPPVSMLHDAAAMAGSAVAWVEDHSHEGWQILPPPAEFSEFPYGEFDDGRQLREPTALPEPDRWDWLTERGGEPEDWEPVHD